MTTSNERRAPELQAQADRGRATAGRRSTAESAREKSIRHGHPSTLHLWWARRPLAAARAVLFAQLVDDPSSHPDRFPTEDAQRAERERLLDIIERLVVWENTRDEALLAEAHAEILESSRRQSAADPRPVRRRRHDPARGPAPRPGGARLRPQPGRGAHQQGADRDPAEVRRPAARVSRPRRRPHRRVGRAPKAWPPTSALRRVDARRGRAAHRPPLPARRSSTTARGDRHRLDLGATVTCPNPACGVKMPLVRSWWLGKKKGKERYVHPVPDGKHVRFEIRGPDGLPREGTVGRTGAECLLCGAAKLSRCREAFEFDRWRAGVGDAGIAGTFDPVGVVAGAFDDAGAGPHPARRVEPFQYLGEGCCGDRGQVVRGERPPAHRSGGGRRGRCG